MPFVTQFSANPQFTWDRGDPHAFSFILSNDVASSVFDMSVTPPRGSEFCFIIVQDGVGGHQFTWPTICVGAPMVGPTPGQTTIQKFILLDGPVLAASGPPMYF